MSILHDGCTAGPMSDWLNGMVGQCCMAHDLALDHGFDLMRFWQANTEFGACVAQTSPALAFVAFLAVSSPIGLLLYRFGPKSKR